MGIYIGIGALVIAGIVAIKFIRKWKQAKADTIELINSLMTNAEENLGYPPDASSLTYLANHPFLSAKIWELLGVGGARNYAYFPEYLDDCERLMNFIHDDNFRREYPCAHAIFQYTVYLFDFRLTGEPKCGHPKDELAAARQAVADQNKDQ